MVEFENTECSALSKKYRLHFEDAVFAQGLIPRKLLLDGTRNIHSYFVFCKYENENIYSAYWSNNNFKRNIKRILALQYSDLDRPLFFVYRDKDNKYKTIEGGEIREALLDKPAMDVTSYIISNSYPLIDLICNIKKEL